MAERRMFTKKVTDDDNFMALSSSAQALYLHLSMSADDDGFCNQVSVSMFKAHASVADLQQLLEKRYIYQFDNGVIVIKHWRMANALRKDRYTPTNFKEELAKLKIKSNGAYTFSDDGCRVVANGLPDGCQVVASLEPQHNLTKHNITEQRKDIMSDKSDDVKTVIDYLNQKNGTSYRASSKKNKSLINARFSEGYSVDDFKKVIDIKSNDWIGTDMAKFFRPETLFGNKFDGYLNQVPIKKQAPVGSRVPEWAKEEYDDNKVVPDW